MALAPDAAAQCTTSSPLSLPSGSLLGPELGAARQASWALYSQATTGWVGFPRQLADNQKFEGPESARYDLFLTTVQATALHRSGTYQGEPATWKTEIGVAVRQVAQKK